MPVKEAIVPTRQAGFTLIELMIVVVILGILAAIAYPSYQNQVRKTKRTDAKNALTELANRQEKYYAQCNTYASSITGAFPSGGSGCTTGTPGLGGSTTSPEGYYTLSLPATSASSFTLQADAVATKSQANDTGCTQLTLSSTGSKGPTSNCW